MVPAPLPRYNTPPLNELVIGVRVTPLILDAGRACRTLWRRINKDFPNSEQVAPLGSDMMPIQGKFVPMPRFWFISTDKTRLVQLQRDRFPL